MMLEAKERGCLAEMAVIASALSIHDPRERPAEKQRQADMAHARFIHPSSDFLTLLNIWKAYTELTKQPAAVSKIRKFCKENFLSFRRVREWRDIFYQISAILEEQEISGPIYMNGLQQDEKPSGTGFSAFYGAVHQAVLSGFLSNIAMKKEKQFFRGARDREVMIFPGSGLFANPGSWIVAAEMVETTRLFARMAANINPEWIEPLAGDQCRYTYLHPHWERSRGEVIALEQVSLYGLIIHAGRPVPYGKINPQEAAEIFIRSALVEGDMRQSFDFMKHNRELIDGIQDMEDRLRRRGLLVSDEEIFRFYADRLEGIWDVRSLKAMLRTRKGDGFLRMKTEDLMLSRPDPEELCLYPERISLGNTVFPCEYVFDPGQEKDGVTVKIASDTASGVPVESLDWVVPGLFLDKVTALLRGLPKTFRRQLAPVSNTAKIIEELMPRNPETPLITALSRFIFDRFGVDVPASAWDTGALPEHLKMRISVLGPLGEELRAGREVSVLFDGPVPAPDLSRFESIRKQWERTGITAWDFGDLPESIDLKGPNGEKWSAYPGLQTEDNGISLRLFEDRTEAINSHKLGVARLFSLHFSKELRVVKQQFVFNGDAEKAARYFGGSKVLENKLYESLIRDLFSVNIRKAQDFEAHAQSAGPMIAEKGAIKYGRTLGVINAFQECRAALYEMENADRNHTAIIAFLSGLRDDLARLVPENFVYLYPAERMEHLERYIRAILLRARRGIVNPEKDQVKAGELKIHLDRLKEIQDSLTDRTGDEKKAAADAFFWLIEEYKVSLFAQELKTPVKVSAKRLEEKYQEILRMV
jgi:ATP-dependent helicase HrpA